jgi:hypothetical protein
MSFSSHPVEDIDDAARDDEGKINMRVMIKIALFDFVRFLLFYHIFFHPASSTKLIDKVRGKES